jgi:hypothetical protein
LTTNSAPFYPVHNEQEPLPRRPRAPGRPKSASNAIARQPRLVKAKGSGHEASVGCGPQPGEFRANANRHDVGADGRRFACGYRRYLCHFRQATGSGQTRGSAAVFVTSYGSVRLSCAIETPSSEIALPAYRRGDVPSPHRYETRGRLVAPLRQAGPDRFEVRNSPSVTLTQGVTGRQHARLATSLV